MWVGDKSDKYISRTIAIIVIECDSVAALAEAVHIRMEWTCDFALHFQ